MTRHPKRLSPKRQALVDQFVAVLRDAEGFPLSTGQIAGALGDRLVSYHRNQRPDRPACWPDDVKDPGVTGRALCCRCHCYHREPVWRPYHAEDVRPLLHGLARNGAIEKVTVESHRQFYWRRDDTDS
jgi:hypothetical protein